MQMSNYQLGHHNYIYIIESCNKTISYGNIMQWYKPGYKQQA